MLTPSLVHPIMMNNDNRKKVQEDNGNKVNKPTLDNNVLDEHVEQVPPESLVEP